MSTETDLIVQKWVDSIERTAKRRARGTQMARDFRGNVKNGLIIWNVDAYGAMQNAGVKGKNRTSALSAINKAQRKAIDLGIGTRKYQYKDKMPPWSRATGPFVRLSQSKSVRFLIARSIFLKGFPRARDVSKSNLNWLNNAFEKGLKNTDQMTDDLINLFTSKIYKEA